MSFDIEEVGEKIGGAFKGKNGKFLIIGGVGIAAALLFVASRKPKQPEEVVLSSYPQAPTADQAAANNTVYDQMAALSDTFTDSLTNMNTQFTDVLNAQQESFQGQIDQLSSQMNSAQSSYAEAFNTLNENVSEQIGNVNKSVADVSTNLLDFAAAQADKYASYSPLPDIDKPQTSTPTTTSAISANQTSYLQNLVSGVTPTGGTATAGQSAWASAQLEAANQQTYLTNLAAGKTSTGGSATAGQSQWAKAELAKTTPSTTPAKATAASAAQNQKTYLQNLAAGKNSDGTKASAGNVAWAKAQLKK